MNYIVLDLEWNQSASGKNRELKSLPFEIIEIGAIKLNDEFEIVDEFQNIVRPVIYPQMHYISQEITGFTSSDLKSGGKFPKVFNRFMEWCGEDAFRFCTWGPLDLTELQRNMKHYNLPLFPAPVFYYDIQEIFSIFSREESCRRSLEYAVEFFSLKKEEGFHRALSDAYYTAMVMRCMEKEIILRNYTIDTYQKPDCPENEIHINYEDHSKYVSRKFINKTEALKDTEVVSAKCCKCGRRLRKKIHWFSDNSKNYYCLAFCPDHGYLAGKIHIKKTEDNHYFVIKELKLTDESGAGMIYEKRNEFRRKRRLRRSQNASYHQ